MDKNSGGPAFPLPNGCGDDLWRQGMSLRDYFAVRAPQPTEDAIKAIAERERMANPHGDTYKPPRRSWREIECALRYEWADAMLKAREQ